MSGFDKALPRPDEHTFRSSGLTHGKAFFRQQLSALRAQVRFGGGKADLTNAVKWFVLESGSG